MELYVKLGEGGQERFEPIQTNPTNDVMRIMIDYEFIKTMLRTPSPEHVLGILNLAWSAKSVREAVTKYRGEAEVPIPGDKE